MNLLDRLDGNRIKISNNLNILKIVLRIVSLGSFGEIKDMNLFLHVKISNNTIKGSSKWYLSIAI